MTCSYWSTGRSWAGGDPEIVAVSAWGYSNSIFRKASLQDHFPGYGDLLQGSWAEGFKRNTQLEGTAKDYLHTQEPLTFGTLPLPFL